MTMKTPEELADEYANKHEHEGGQAWGGAYGGFLAGYQAGRSNNEVVQTAAPQWISVKDRLPEDGKKVLGFVYNEVRFGFIDLISTDPGQFHWVDEGMYIDKGHYALTHWMPLPKLPKE